MSCTLFVYYFGWGKEAVALFTILYELNTCYCVSYTAKARLQNFIMGDFIAYPLPLQYGFNLCIPSPSFQNVQTVVFLIG